MKILASIVALGVISVAGCDAARANADTNISECGQNLRPDLTKVNTNASYKMSILDTITTENFDKKKQNGSLDILGGSFAIAATWSEFEEARNAYWREFSKQVNYDYNQNILVRSYSQPSLDAYSSCIRENSKAPFTMWIERFQDVGGGNEDVTIMVKADVKGVRSAHAQLLFANGKLLKDIRFFGNATEGIIVRHPKNEGVSVVGNLYQDGYPSDTDSVAIPPDDHVGVSYTFSPEIRRFSCLVGHSGNSFHGNPTEPTIELKPPTGSEIDDTYTLNVEHYDHGGPPILDAYDGTRPLPDYLPNYLKPFPKGYGWLRLPSGVVTLKPLCIGSERAKITQAGADLIINYTVKTPHYTRY